jgi:hypothetical protein
MKLCGCCQQEKALSDFNKNVCKPDGLQTTCRACQRQSSKAYYENNRKRMVRQILAARTKRRRMLQRFLLDYLAEHPCVDCGEDDIVVLDFDHVRGVKEMAIADLVAGVHSLAALKAEIAKCDIRCANCHRRKTMRDRVSYRWLSTTSLEVG